MKIIINLLKRLVSSRKLIILSVDESLKSCYSFCIKILRMYVMKFYACNEEIFNCERVVTRNTKWTLFIIQYDLACWGLRKNVCCKNLVSIRVSIFSLFFLKDWHLFMTYWWMFDLKSEWGFFKLVIDSDKADLASRSASSLPRMLMWLGK